MELVRDTEETQQPERERHVFRWAALLIGAILTIEDWRIALGFLVVAAVLLFLALALTMMILIRKATRPIAQLTVLDVALLSWAHRRWENRRARREPKARPRAKN